MVAQLLGDLRACTTALEIVVTVNVPEADGFRAASGARPVRIVRNDAVKGFGANHNAAFRASHGEFFCVVNPDLRLRSDPFPRLLQCLRGDTLGVVAPRVESPSGQLEHSARQFPTPLSILAKALGARDAPPPVAQGLSHPDWLAGMFMLFPREAFGRVGGFDESYFLYYEDVDICARLRKLGYQIGYCADATVVHDARRTSHRDARYLRWHLASMARFFWRRALGRL